ncbi:MAG TPA: sel1 repeat family protein, partial [Nannocystis exedens]|nr:sel1 repeat family protein [Nannocystis exedens]
MYDGGEGVPPDPHRAAGWLRFAVERGHAGCQAELGRRYEHRQSVPRDDAEACIRFTLAAANG